MFRAVKYAPRRDSSYARRAIHSRDTTIWICSVQRLKSKNMFVKISYCVYTQLLCQKVMMSLAEYFCWRLFVQIFQIYGHILSTS